MGRVVEGAEHARDVTRRGLGHTALGERLRRLALEVDERPFPVGRAQALAEMQIAVDALSRPGMPLGGQIAQRLERGAQGAGVGP